MHLEQDLIDAVDKWCPKGFAHETFAVRVFRAFLNARACCADLRRVLAGKQPIRPLDDYPVDNF